MFAIDMMIRCFDMDDGVLLTKTKMYLGHGKETDERRAVATATTIMTIHVTVLMQIDAIIIAMFVHGITPYPIMMSQPLIFGIPGPESSGGTS